MVIAASFLFTTAFWIAGGGDARAVVTVDDARDLLGQPTEQQRHAHDVAIVLAPSLVRAAEDHIIHCHEVTTRMPLDPRLHCHRAETPKKWPIGVRRSRR